MLTRTTVKWVSLVFGIACLLEIGILTAHPEWCEPRVLKSVTIPVKQFTAGEPLVTQTESTDAPNKDIRITFRMKVPSFSNGYPNIFQTAPINSGLRMELSSSGNLGLLVAHKLNQVQGYSLTDHYPFNEWHAVSVHIDVRHHIQLTFD